MTYFLLLLCTGHEETCVGVHPKCLSSYFKSCWLQGPPRLPLSTQLLYPVFSFFSSLFHIYLCVDFLPHIFLRSLFSVAVISEDRMSFQLIALYLFIHVNIYSFLGGAILEKRKDLLLLSIAAQFYVLQNTMLTVKPVSRVRVIVWSLHLEDNFSSCKHVLLLFFSFFVLVGLFRPPWPGNPTGLTVTLRMVNNGSQWFKIVSSSNIFRCEMYTTQIIHMADGKIPWPFFLCFQTVPRSECPVPSEPVLSSRLESRSTLSSLFL